MRLKILIVFVFLAIVTAACGVSSPVLSSGPSLPYQSEGSSVEAAPAQAAEEANPGTTAAQPPQGLDLSSGYPLALKDGSPRYLPAFTQPDAGCAWVGVAGQVFDRNGAPLEGVVVLVKGYFNHKLIDVQTLSGLQKAYGEAGFEVQIGDLSADSQNALTIQLGNSKFEALSEVYPITTYDDCQRNLIMVNFQAVSDAYQAYLP